MADIYPPDPTTDVGKVRLFTIDSVLRSDPRKPQEIGEYIFSDAAVQGFIDANPMGLRFAAADIMDSIASNLAYVVRDIKTEDLSTNGAVTARSIREQAASLRAQGKLELDRSEAADSFFVVDNQPQRSVQDTVDLLHSDPYHFGWY